MSRRVVLLVACWALMLTRVAAAPAAPGWPQENLSVDLAADQEPSDRLPSQFRVTLVNRSRRDLFESGPSFIMFVAGDEYARARAGDVAAAPIHLKPGEKRVLQVPVASLEFRAPTGNQRTLSEVEARLSRAHWSIVAIMGDVTHADHAESSVPVQSNELAFGPRP